MADADLREYRERRDFGATPEPPPAPPAPPPDGRRRFVVQRHDARALHFDLRLEVDGALASWAVPKGPPLREGIRRLAVRTEDHPLEYLTFAGVIPQAQYGAGRMSVWDSGTYEEELRADDEWKLVLEGGILRGHYHLVRTGERSGKEEWLIFRSGKGPAGARGPGAADARHHADAGLHGRRPVRRPRVGLRAEVGRLPRPRAGHLGRDRPAQPQRAGPHAPVSRARRPAPPPDVPGGGPRRRGGGPAPRRDARLRRPGGGTRPVHLRRVRPAARRRRVDRGPALARAPRAPGAGGGPRGAAAGGAERPRGGRGDGAVRGRGPARAGGHHGQAHGRPLPPGPAGERLAQDQDPAGAAGRDRRLHRGRGLAPRHDRGPAGGRARRRRGPDVPVARRIRPVGRRGTGPVGPPAGRRGGRVAVRQPGARRPGHPPLGAPRDRLRGALRRAHRRRAPARAGLPRPGRGPGGRHPRRALLRRRTARAPWRRASGASRSPTSTSRTGRARASPRATCWTTTCASPRCSCPTWRGAR